MEAVCSLGSGSKGNATLLVGSESIFLIDAGFSKKRLDELLHQVGYRPEDVQGILITHEHHDHICGLETFVKNHQIPIYANKLTAKFLHANMNCRPKFRIFETDVPFQLHEFEVLPFSIPHDAVDPVGYTFSLKQHKLGICTDVGFKSANIVRSLKGCTHLILESNHDINMVHASNRPMVYKKRVLSKQGHLCNEESRQLLEEILSDKLKQVAFAHLSQECNHPSMVEKAMEGIGVTFSILSQNGPNPFMYFNTTSNQLDLEHVGLK
jgi:phosphoribosyl 1,2-cyclic phosphodiesterase